MNYGYTIRMETENLDIYGFIKYLLEIFKTKQISFESQPTKLLTIIDKINKKITQLDKKHKFMIFYKLNKEAKKWQIIKGRLTIIADTLTQLSSNKENKTIDTRIAKASFNALEELLEE